MTNLIEKYVPKKYQHCVVDLYKDVDGWWCELKHEYISTVTEASTIHEDTVVEMKKQFKTIVPRRIEGAVIVPERQVFVKRPAYDNKLIEAIERTSSTLLVNEVVDGSHLFKIKLMNRNVLTLSFTNEASSSRYFNNETTYYIRKFINDIEVDDKLHGLGITNFVKLIKEYSK